MLLHDFSRSLSASDNNYGLAAALKREDRSIFLRPLLKRPTGAGRIIEKIINEIAHPGLR